MSLHLQMLGTGSAFAKKYYNNNALVQCNGAKLLIDCGYTAPRALHELGITPDQIDGILVTHLHADHIGGIEEMAFQLHYLYHKKTKLFVPSLLQRTLWENSLKGSMESLQEGLTGLSSFFDVIILHEEQPLECFDGIQVEIIRTEHIPGKPSFSLVLNQKIFYSADIRFSPDFLQNEVVGARNCQHILHDCQLKGPGIVHTALAELLSLPESIQSKIYLMHYDDDMESYIGQTGPMEFIKQQHLYTFF